MLLDASVREIAFQIRAGQLSPTEVVNAHIDRIESVNGVLNALAADRFEEARREAHEAEQLLARHDPSELPPLLGVPFTAKEFLAVKGMPNSGGLVRRAHVRAEQDATTVSRVRAAGAICLGVTNAAEAGLWCETKNRVYGRTNNPWNPGCTPGGSSGGSGALVAAGGVPFDLGADVGGSIRIPAGLCGTVGHKPSGRLIPNTGQFPGGHGEINAYLTIGPLCRRVEDILPLLRVMAGPDGADPVTRPMPLGVPEEVSFEGRRLLVLEDHGREKTSAPIRDALRGAAEALVGEGMAHSEWSSPDLRQSFDMWAGALACEPGPTYREMVDIGAMGTLAELVRYPFGRSAHMSMVLGLLLVEPVLSLFPGRNQRFRDLARALRVELDEALGPGGVMLHPVYATTAPRHHAMLLRPFSCVYTSLFNVLEYPSTVVPVGFDSRGLPISLQVIARRGEDHVAVAVAAALERHFGGWVRAEPSEP